MTLEPDACWGNPPCTSPSCRWWKKVPVRQAGMIQMCFGDIWARADPTKQWELQTKGWKVYILAWQLWNAFTLAYLEQLYKRGQSWAAACTHSSETHAVTLVPASSSFSTVQLPCLAFTSINLLPWQISLNLLLIASSQHGRLAPTLCIHSQTPIQLTTLATFTVGTSVTFQPYLCLFPSLFCNRESPEKFLTPYSLTYSQLELPLINKPDRAILQSNSFYWILYIILQMFVQRIFPSSLKHKKSSLCHCSVLMLHS